MLHAYKSGYHHPFSYLEHGGNKLHLEKVKIPPEDIEKRIATLREAARQISCYSAGENKKSVVAFHEALYEEALAYAGGEVFEDLLFPRRLVDENEFGDDVAWNRHLSSLRGLKNKGVASKETRVLLINNPDQEALGPD